MAVAQPGSSNVFYKGGRLLFDSSSVESYGLEYSQFFDSSKKTFQSVGIILEKSIFGWIMASIGTIGYFNYKNTAENMVGLVSNRAVFPH